VTTAAERIRDAERSRRAILAAAERLFADHGYAGTTIARIAEEAGLSRGAPNYFFGSKEKLYREVIDATFVAREDATRAAFESVRSWAVGSGGLDELRLALGAAARDYMTFLAKRPSFVKLVMREELAGGAAVQRRLGRSRAMEDAFGAVRADGVARGLRPFAVADAVLLFVALTFAPLSYSSTWMRAAERDVRKAAGRERQVELAVEQLMHLLAG
jgi:TetR/AcrR family transcriptional regulator